MNEPLTHEDVEEGARRVRRAEWQYDDMED